MKKYDELVLFDVRSNTKVEVRRIGNGQVKWSCAQTNMKKWPKNIKERYCEIVREEAKHGDRILKLKKFFYTKGIENDTRLYQELFRGLNIKVSQDDVEYIDRTIEEASSYYGESYDGLKKKLLNEEIAI